MKIRLRDIKLFDLDSQTVLQINKFVSRARSRDGVSIRLNDPLIVRKVVYYGLHTEDSEMKSLFQAIYKSLVARYDNQANVPPLPTKSGRQYKNGNSKAVA